MARKPAYQREIAEERIHILFDEAENAFDKHPERAHRYVEIARNIAMKFNLSMPDDLKTRFCPNCYVYWNQGANMRVRLKNGTKHMTCKDCGETVRRPYKE